jgi:deoxyribose-phosphate aldolase
VSDEMFMGDEIPKDFLIVALNCLDIAVLDPGVEAETLRGICERAKNPGEGLRPAAGVAVLPEMVEVAAEALADSPVRVVCATGGFPEGTLDVVRRQPQVKKALRLGAQEIDTVLNWRALLNDDEATAFEEIAGLKKWMGEGKLKVIIESGALGSEVMVRKATEVAILAGADFVKTSTGTVEPGATQEAAQVMMVAIQEHYAKTGKMIGIKISGGIRDSVQVVDYMSTLIGTLGFAWLSPATFRFGASDLLDDLLARIAAA